MDHMGPFDTASRALQQLMAEVDALRAEVASLRGMLAQPPAGGAELAALREQLATMGWHQQQTSAEVAALSSAQQRTAAEAQLRLQASPARDRQLAAEPLGTANPQAMALGGGSCTCSQMARDIVGHHARWMKTVNELQVHQVQQISELSLAVEEVRAHCSADSAALRTVRDTTKAQVEDSGLAAKVHAVQLDVNKVVHYLQSVGASWDSGLEGLRDDLASFKTGAVQPSPSFGLGLSPRSMQRQPCN